MNEFQKARIRLTLWYLALALLLLSATNVVAIDSERRAFDRIERALGDREERPRLTQLLETNLNQFEVNFQKRLFALDSLLVILAAVGSYFLSGRTLQPIEETIREQEAFAADASHELRTPLTTIGMEITALKKTSKRIPKEVEHALTTIASEVERMKGIVAGLLTLVRHTHGYSGAAKIKLNLALLAKDVYQQMLPVARKRGLDLSFRSGGLIEVLGVADDLKQVMLILVDNAFKYTAKRGRVELSVGTSGKQAIVAVSDTGVGMRERDLPHIFERFYRGSSGSERKGLGLGLSIAKRVVEQHNGTISVESTLGKGSRFMVRLPAA